MHKSPLRQRATKNCRALVSWFPGFLVILFVSLAASGCAAPVRVEWSTETEMNTAGFNLYRGE